MNPLQILSRLAHNILLLISVLGGLLATVVYATMGFLQFLDSFQTWAYDLLPILNVFYVMTLLLGLAALDDKHPKRSLWAFFRVKTGGHRSSLSLHCSANEQHTGLDLHLGMGRLRTNLLPHNSRLGVLSHLSLCLGLQRQEKKYAKSVDESSS